MSRLPVPGSDDNTWGDILNDYLGVSLNTDGTIKTGTIGSSQIVDGSITTTDISASAAIARTQLSSGVQSSLASADSALQSVPNATSTITGGVRLTGDLGGTATAPTTPTAVHVTGAETIAGTKTFTDPATNFYDVFAPMASTSDTNYNFVVTPDVSPRSLAFNPASSVAFHDQLAFNRFWGTPLFYTSADAVSYSSGTLEPGLFSQHQGDTYTIIDGTSAIAARWVWNNANVGNSYARTWVFSFPYQVPTPSRTITIETSSNGTAWTSRATKSGYAGTSTQLYLLAADWSGDTYVRVTISVSNSLPLKLGLMKALTPRWGDQGGGSETSVPFGWDSAARISIGSGLNAYSNGVLNIGGSTPTTAGSGVYFGTDTNLYRSGNTTLKTDSKFVAGGGLQIGSSSTSGQVWTATDTNGNGSWQTFSSSGFGRSVNLMSASVTAGSTAFMDYIYYWTSSTAYTLTMPAASGNTNRYTIKNNSSVAQTVSASTGQIEGSASISILSNDSVDLISNGTNWMII